jgi:hypothetical protein
VVEALAQRKGGFPLQPTSDLRFLQGAVADLLDTLEDHQAMARSLLAELLALMVAQDPRDAAGEAAP